MACNLPETPFNFYRALSPRAAADELHSFFKRDDIGLIICSIGGFTTNAILRHIDWDILRSSPKNICGYSDATALLLAIRAMTNQVALLGPALMPQWGDPHGPLEFTRVSFLEAITATGSPRECRPSKGWVDPRVPWEGDPIPSFHELPQERTAWRTIRPGKASGRLVGGNVETLNTLIGTRYLPSFERSLLVLEATGAEAYLPRFHRALIHMGDAGILDDVKGVLVGRSPGLTAGGVEPLESALLDVFPDSRVPVVIDADFGHTEPSLTIPLGLTATLLSDGCESELLLHDFTNETAGDNSAARASP